MSKYINLKKDIIVMKKLKLQIASSFFIILILNGSVVTGLFQSHVNETALIVEKRSDATGFYFVHISDTHVAAKWYDHNETRKQWLTFLLKNIASFTTPPAFVVITGDLVEWGEGFFGALNYHAFTQCFFINHTQLYADRNCSIPVYFTPGNHDYYPYRVLWNYHLFVKRLHVEEHDHYIITYKNLSLLFMDSGPNSYATYDDKINSLAVGLSNDDIDWLNESLKASSTAYKIVLMHHPAINLRNQDDVMYDVFIHHREQFIELCENNDVDVVLAGHTHEARVFDAEEHLYENVPLNTSHYSTLFVQSDDCKEGVHYRNVSFIGNDLWIEPSQEVHVTRSIIL